MWSIAVCDAVRRPSTDNPGEGSAREGGSRAVGQVSGRLDGEPGQTRAGSDNSGNPDGRQRGGSLMKNLTSPMPHQRNGHICFVWDTSQIALAGGSESAKSASPSNGQASGKEVWNRTNKGQEVGRALTSSRHASSGDGSGSSPTALRFSESLKMYPDSRSKGSGVSRDNVRCRDGGPRPQRRESR